MHIGLNHIYIYIITWTNYLQNTWDGFASIMRSGMCKIEKYPIRKVVVKKRQEEQEAENTTDYTVIICWIFSLWWCPMNKKAPAVDEESTRNNHKCTYKMRLEPIVWCDTQDAHSFEVINLVMMLKPKLYKI